MNQRFDRVHDRRHLRCPARGHRCRAFTLIEMLVVLAIIGILAGISLPAVKSITRSNVMADADRQLLDDLGHARQRAINGRTTVYVVFSPVASDFPPNPAGIFNPLSAAERETLITGQLTSYALFSLRSVGAQPGAQNPRYLTRWKTLPSGVFIPAVAFTNFPARNDIPVPKVGGVFPPNVRCIAFDHFGRLVPQQNVTIPLARGSIFYQRKANGTIDDAGFAAIDPQENPPGNAFGNNFNRVFIDALTGRAKVQRPEIP